MRLPIDKRAFAQERRRFNLRYCCEDCAYFVGTAQACAHDWPNLEHRRLEGPDDVSSEVVYCKEYELR